MRTLLTILVFICASFFIRIAAQPPIGLWKEYLPYNSAIDVAPFTGDKIICATPYSLFTVDKSNTIERMSRITGLSETGISAISYDAANEKLFIAYNNSNIDILYRNDIINLPGLMSGRLMISFR